MTAALARDPCSLSNPEIVVTTHLKLDLALDFDRHIISGTADYTVRLEETGAQTLVLDTSRLIISRVEVDGVRTEFLQRPAHKVYGTALEITLTTDRREVGTTFSVRITYHTSPESTAVQWLNPEQTNGKEYPYLFTQCQAIHARSFFSCQDTPSAKLTYDAQVEVPKWATCLMSALSTGAPVVASEGSGLIYSFRQPVPIPSYLVALAVGDLQSREISHRCKIWAEPGVVDAAAYDFSETEVALQTAESLTCPYLWGRYDVLCLPASFPYGGMENPCLTFVTPTLLSGDKSLAVTIYHEISHSWTGNLITNRTWEHFWLNEGWTMWLQRKIIASMRNDEKAFDFDAQIGFYTLKDSVELFESRGEGALTALCPPLDGIDPDDAFSSVPYEKGFALLMDLETRVGTPAFESFAKAYIEKFKYGTITSEEFKDFFVAHFSHSADKLEGLDWDKWFHAPGMPQPQKPQKYDDTLSKASLELAAKWINSTDGSIADTMSNEYKTWSSPQRVMFLEGLLEGCAGEKKLSVPSLNAIDSAYGMSTTKNCEIKFRWQMLCLKCGHLAVLPQVLEFLTSQGRMKYTRPLYRELSKHPETADEARKVFLDNSGFYHPICTTQVARDLDVVLPASITSSSS